jgi:outer membrane protein assembly factor BamB
VVRSNRVRNSLAYLIVILFIVSIIVLPNINSSHVSFESKEDYTCLSYDGYDPRLSAYEKYILTNNKYNNSMFILKEVSHNNLNSHDENQMIPESSTQNSYCDSMNSSWPMRSHDLHRSGQSPYSTQDNPLIEKWRFPTRSWVYGSPVIDKNGTIYVDALDLYAITANGSLAWKSDFIMGESTAAIDKNGIIYIGTSSATPDRFYAFYPNGTKKWSYLTGTFSVFSSPAIGDDGIIYFGECGYNNDAFITALYPNGTLKWHYQTGDWVMSSPAIGDDGTIYCGSHDRYLYALNPNGTLKWKFATGDWIRASPSIASDGTIYVGSYDNHLYALYPNNGTMKWNIEIGYGCDGNPSIANDGTIYVGSDKLYAVNPNGTLRWSFNLGENRNIVFSCPAISSDGTIYVGLTGFTHSYMTSGELLAVNPDGTERWRSGVICNVGIWSSPAIAEDGTVYIGSLDDISEGYLHAFGQGPLNINANGPYSGHVNENVQFTGTAYGGMPPYQYYWDFGDGQNSHQQNPTHNYSIVGNFTATLMITDSEGNQSSDTASVYITYAHPKVEISKPEDGIYIFNVWIYEIPNLATFIFGPITVTASVEAGTFPIDHVVFMVNEKVVRVDRQQPYIWRWVTPAWGSYALKVVAYDAFGNTDSDEMGVWKFF